MRRPPPRPPEWQERLGGRLFRALAPPLHGAPTVQAAPAEMLPYEDLTIPCSSCSGVISATWFPAFLAPRGAVLLIHPWLNWGRAYFHRRGRLEALRAAGYHALTIDLPGFGGSSRPAGFYDWAIEDALGELEKRSCGLDLFVWGVSSGGYWAHPVLARTDQVAGAMFEDVSPHLLEWAWRASPKARPMHLLFRRLFPLVYKYLDVRQHAGALDLGAVSYVSGALDDGVRPEDTCALAELAGGSYSIVQGAGHLSAIKVANRAVIRTALETFERAAENSTTAVLRPAEVARRSRPPVRALG